ncbi:DUF7344 domain-containing protein [Pyrococcus yayanosii]|uniref:DUF7344 domain-containing protein n=1 Tax=Pyrococcus yayanosii (strain CH1 / JCM 16557) TaxID=529709 RepID=F8AF75_PYRYC|nr:hypothetical protein [Pyrococcus yayanosii]AEH24903.1 hypothetical protein PYCH_12250 [Pyrococcus yayanosii CH1]
MILPLSSAGLMSSPSSMILGNDRRTWIIEFLQKNGKEAEISELVDYITKIEGNTSRRHRKSVYVSLVQTHLPKLKREGIVEIKRGTIRLLQVPDDVNAYIVVRKKKNIWAMAYALLASISLIGAALKVNPEGVMISLAFLALSLFHWAKTSHA